MVCSIQGIEDVSKTYRTHIEDKTMEISLSRPMSRPKIAIPALPNSEIIIKAGIPDGIFGGFIGTG
jgi:hypothetical protein